MTLLEPRQAVKINGVVLFLVLAFLVSTPIRVQVFVAVMVLYSVAYLFVNRDGWTLSFLDVCVLMLMSLYSLSHLPVFIISDFSWRYLSPGLHMVVVFPVYLMFRHASRDVAVHHYRDSMEWGASIGALLAAGVALYQTQWLGASKADGFLFHINFGYLVCSLCLLCVMLFQGSNRKIVLGIGAGAGLLATLLSISRGAILVIPIVLFFLLLLNFRRLGLMRVMTSIIAVLVVAWGSYMAVPLVKERVKFTVQEFSDIAEGDVASAVSSGGRLQLWFVAVEAFKERPLVGLTYEERERLNAKLVDEGKVTEWVNSVSRGHAHSQYFETLATGGIVGGLALFGYLLLPGVFYLVFYLRCRDNCYALVGLVFSLSFSLFCLTEVALQHEMIATYYAYMQVSILVLVLTSHRRWQSSRPGKKTA